MCDSRRHFTSILVKGVVLLEAVILVACDELTTTDDYLAPGYPLVGCSGKPADVVFVLDTSNSIWSRDFREQLQFVRDVITLFPIDAGYVRVGLMTYADFPTLHFHLAQYGREADVQSAIARIRHVGGYGTRTAEALRFLREVGFQYSVSEDRINVTRVGIVVTDGLSDNPKQTRREAERTRKQGVHLFAVGVGSNRDLEELEAIASHPTQDYTILADSYSGLDSIRKLLAIKTCAVTNPSTTTTTTTTTPRTTTTTTFSTRTEGPRRTTRPPTRSVSLGGDGDPILRTLVPMTYGPPPVALGLKDWTSAMPTSTRSPSAINLEDVLTTTVESRATKRRFMRPTVRFDDHREISEKPVEHLENLPGSDGKESTLYELQVAGETVLTHQGQDGNGTDERGTEDRISGHPKESNPGRTNPWLKDDLKTDHSEKSGVDNTRDSVFRTDSPTAWTPGAGDSRGKDPVSVGKGQVHGKDTSGLNETTEDGASGRGSGDGISGIKEDGRSRNVSGERNPVGNERIGDGWSGTKEGTSRRDGVAEESGRSGTDSQKSKVLVKRPVFWKLDTDGRSFRIWREEFKLGDDKVVPSVTNGSTVAVEGDKLWSSGVDGNRSLVGEVVNGSKFIGRWVDTDRRIWFGYVVMDTAGIENNVSASRNGAVPEAGDRRQGSEEGTAFPGEEENSDEDGTEGLWVTDEAGRSVWFDYLRRGVYGSRSAFLPSSGTFRKTMAPVEVSTNGVGSKGTSPMTRGVTRTTTQMSKGCRPRQPTDIAFVLDHKSSNSELVQDIWVLARAIVSDLDAEGEDLLSFQFVHKCSGSACLDQIRYSSKADALRAVDATLVAIRSNSSHVIDKMMDSLKDSEGRRRRKVGVYMTDSRSENFDETIRASDRAKLIDDIEMFAVGFGGGANPTELQAMASCPVAQHYYLLDRRLNDQTAKAVARKISRLVCSGRNEA